MSIRSVSDGVVLILGPVRDEQGYYYKVQVTSPVVGGLVEVYDHHASHLAEFFAQLSNLWWTGWDGDRAYESLESQLRLVARRDAVGHVYLRVELWDGMGGADFKLGATLVLDSGELEVIAKGVRDALTYQGAAEQRDAADKGR